MPDKPRPSKPEPEQRTPRGLEIPVPKWREVMRDLEKVAKPSERRDRRQKPTK